METLNFYEIAEVQAVYLPPIPSSRRPKIVCSRDSAAILKQEWNHNLIEYQEEFKIILLNRGNRVLGLANISMGGQAGTLADPKVIFTRALIASAASIILAHNHPSGNLKPSQADITMTENLVKGGKILDITVLDHIILSPEGDYYSFADEGLISA